MAIENLHDFLVTYFTTNHCQVNSNKKDGTLNVQLTEEMDERLMNRPFYWQYVRKLNQVGSPLELKITTQYNKANKDRAYLSFGTERFNKICNDALSKGRFTKLYQSIAPRQQTALYPWLIINVKMSYIGKQQEEDLKSYGIHLINGTIIDQAFEWLEQKEWTTTIPDFCYPITPLIQVRNGYLRIEHFILEQLQAKQHQWAEASYQHLQEEIQLLNYSKDREQSVDENHYLKEKENLKAIYQPKISLQVINGGMFYLAEP
ncbi:YqhG family protein [Amphibacillus jilinensis]|uniref:YqhG family protein n=1 Tax=Amphibacillus jilinensis TaxID=1216008 RepID=UPI0002EA2C4F|nr:YqhG family protein [Amphibacillus jilinensis]